jgi:hypothetical protein
LLALCANKPHILICGVAAQRAATPHNHNWAAVSRFARNGCPKE